ncbi:hypothetical protein [Chryseobacterium aquaeductus]|nr:hypothetical protein [Chryseobacterium aquaeductus]
MKKNLLIRLCLMMIALLSLPSCRQDILQEQETYNNSGAFQLTSKRISLNEAKHKTKLLPALKQVETAFKTQSKGNQQGKTVNYGNGVSIDTDDVIYIENGTGFHSYTFNIKHENASVDAPVENLVLSPLANGTYRELLLTYSLTPLEKQMLESGVPLDAHGKVTITELAAGTYSSAGLMSKSTTNCAWEPKTMWHECSSGEHNGTNANECDFINNLANGTPPIPYVVMEYKCTALPVDTSLGENGDGGGSGPQNGPGGLSNNPNVPTQPNVPLLIKKSNCAILKENSEDPDFQHKLDSIKTRVMLSTANYDKHETAIVVTNGNGPITYTTFLTPNESGPNVQSVKIEVTNYDIAVMHNHTIKSAFLAPSYLDLVDFYDNYKYLHDSMKKGYIYYLACYNGEVYALKADNIAALDSFFDEFTTIGSGNFSEVEKTKAYEKMRQRYKDNGMEDEVPHDKDKSEKIFLNIAQSFGNGISFYRRDYTVWGKLRLDPDGTVKKDDCPL